MALRLPNASRNAMLNALTARLDEENPGNPGKLKVYSGSRPSDVDNAPPGGATLLATLLFSSPQAFTAAGSAGGNSEGEALSNEIAAATGIVGGFNAAWFTFTDGADLKVVDGTIKQTGSPGSADAELDQVALVTGGTLRAGAILLRVPDA